MMVRGPRYTPRQEGGGAGGGRRCGRRRLPRGGLRGEEGVLEQRGRRFRVPETVLLTDQAVALSGGRL